MKILKTIILIVVSACAAQSILAQNTAFSYQGSLKTNGQPANGNYDIQITLHASDSGNSVVGATITRANVAVVNGFFSVTLDWGTSVYPVFGARFLEIAVRQTGAGAYTTLTPREVIKVAPYAISSFYAETARLADFVGGRTVSELTLTTDPRLSDARDPLPNSPSYIQNGGGVQANSSFNVSGNGTVGGTFSADLIDTPRQYLINGQNALLMNSNSLLVGSAPLLAQPSINNTIIGRNAGDNLFQGDSNTYAGKESGKNLITGSQNSFFGAGAGRDANNGNYNTFIGSETGNGNSSTATGQTMIGAFANVRIQGLSNATAIGFRAAVDRSDSLVLGSSNGVNGATADTNVGIGTSSPSFRLDLVGRMRIQQRLNATGSTDTAGLWFYQRTPNADRAFVGMQDDGKVGFFGNNGAGWGFVMNTQNGNVGVGTTDPQSSLQVNGSEILSTGANAGFKFRNRNSTNANEDWVWYASGNIARLFSPTGGGDLVTVKTTGVMTIAGLGLAGFTQLCRNASNEISTCSSSIRYKDNVQNFRPGLELIKKLRPVSFNWKADGKEDLGLVAEEVAAAEPLLASTNEKGEVEGVKYDRVGVVLVNAVSEQQTQIESLEKKIDEQNELIKKQDEAFKKQQAELEALKRLVCSQNPAAAICQPQN